MLYYSLTFGDGLLLHGLSFLPGSGGLGVQGRLVTSPAVEVLNEQRDGPSRDQAPYQYKTASSTSANAFPTPITSEQRWHRKQLG